MPDARAPRLAAYLYFHADLGLVFSDPHPHECFADASWETRFSTSGCLSRYKCSMAADVHLNACGLVGCARRRVDCARRRVDCARVGASIARGSLR